MESLRHLILATIAFVSLSGCREQKSNEHVEALIKNEMSKLGSQTSIINLHLRVTDETTSKAILGIRGSYVSVNSSNAEQPLPPNPEVLTFDDGIVHSNWAIIGRNYGGILLEADGYQSLVVIPEVSEIGSPDSDGKIRFGSEGKARTVHLKRSEQAGTGQPATRPESRSEGDDKPQPESEGRSR